MPGFPSEASLVMPAKGSRVTHCSRGHRYTDETTYIAPNGKRHCRPCMRIRNERYEKNRPRRPAPPYKRKPCEKCGGKKPPGRARRYCDPCAEEARRDYLEGRQQRQNRRTRIRRYGISLEEYEARLKAQTGVCAICERECGTGQNLSVDHNHETGQVRGLLCRRCNTRLGALENTEWMEKAMEYLKAHDCAPVLSKVGGAS